MHFEIFGGKNTMLFYFLRVILHVVRFPWALLRRWPGLPSAVLFSPHPRLMLEKLLLQISQIK